MKYGIDTSKWQKGLVNFQNAKKEGIDFVFLRIGCGKTKDTYFEKDYEAAVKAGLKVGVYYYTYSTTEAEGTTDATRVLGWLNNRKLDFPIAYDIEDAKQKWKSHRDANSKMYNAFAKKIEEGGIYDAILYTGESFYKNYFNKDILKDDLWIAKYSSAQPNVGRAVAIWQYSSAAITTSYYVGKLDRNKMLNELQGSRTPQVTISHNPYPVPDRTLKKGMTGNDVRWLQFELNSHALTVQVDGKFGPGTDKALRQFQRQNKLLVDGKCGPATRYALINH